MKPTTRKRMPALTPDEARRLKMVSKLTTRLPARKRTKQNLCQCDDPTCSARRNWTARINLLAEATEISSKCERLISRWRKEAVKAEANSIDTGLKWINVQALCIRKCADELERLLNL